MNENRPEDMKDPAVWFFLVLSTAGLACAAIAIGLFSIAAFIVTLIRSTLILIFKPVVAASLVLSLALPGAIRAQPPAEDSADLPDAPRLVGVDRGDRAPFTGILAPESLFVDWRTRIVLLEERLAIDATAHTAALAAHERLSNARLDLERERRELITALYTERVDALRTELIEARDDAKPGFFEHPAFWFAFGVVVTGAAVALAAVALR